MTTSRRDFLKKSSLALGSVSLLNTAGFGFAGIASRTVESFGFQVWTIRKKLVEDFAGTLKMMADLGYKEVEMCSPLGYSIAGFKPLNEMSGTEMRKIIEDAGLKCTSSHFTKGELRDNLDNRIEWAQQLGIKQIILSHPGIPKDSSLDDYKKAAEELNKIAEKTNAAGIVAGYHNHHQEFDKRGEVLIYETLLEELDPDLVKMQFQVAVVNLGYIAADFFRKYPGRFVSAHLADWSEEKEASVPIGQGIVDWKDFFMAAKVGGVKNFFVEMAPETFDPSAKFLSSF
jgi:sugar phosphate isomerase/epimerase